MPSTFSHIVAGLGAGTPLLPRSVPRRYWVAAGLAGAFPDVDWVWSFRGLPTDHWLEHRGVTHSPAFALLLGAVLTWGVLRSLVPPPQRWRVWLALSLGAASHGLFDAMSTYGAGVTFLMPFSSERFFLPWRPINGRTGSGQGLASRVLILFGRELLWVWLPAGLLAGLYWWRSRRIA